MQTRLLGLAGLTFAVALTGTAYIAQHCNPCRTYQDNHAKHYAFFGEQQAYHAGKLATCYRQDLPGE